MWHGDSSRNLEYQMHGRLCELKTLCMEGEHSMEENRHVTSRYRGHAADMRLAAEMDGAGDQIDDSIGSGLHSHAAT